MNRRQAVDAPRILVVEDDESLRQALAQATVSLPSVAAKDRT